MMRLGLLIALTIAITGCSKQTTEDPEPTEPVASAPQTDHAMIEEEVQFQAAGMTIHGVITRPVGDGTFAAIAIAAGSGPTDRDWNSPMLPGDNGSAKLLAAALAQDGVAMLRYDKRGTGKTGMPDGGVTWGNYADELSAAVAVLAAKDYVDPQNIYVAGHSEGGAHALRVAENPPAPLAGVILLSTAGRTLRDVAVWQIANQIRQSGLNPDAAQAEIDAMSTAVDTIAGGGSVDPQSVGQLQGVQGFIMALQNPQSVDFARGLLTYDPLKAFSKFEAPVLVVTGARDIQVDPELDAKPLAEAAKAAGRSVRLEILDRADHVLKIEETPRDQLTPTVGLRYNAPERELDPGVASAIVTFATPAG